MSLLSKFNAAMFEPEPPKPEAAQSAPAVAPGLAREPKEDPPPPRPATEVYFVPVQGSPFARFLAMVESLKSVIQDEALLYRAAMNAAAVGGTTAERVCEDGRLFIANVGSTTTNAMNDVERAHRADAQPDQSRVQEIVARQAELDRERSRLQEEYERLSEALSSRDGNRDKSIADLRERCARAQEEHAAVLLKIGRHIGEQK